MYELKFYRRVMCHENEEWCKIWRGIDLSFQNWDEEFDKFWPRAFERLKNWHFNRLFLTKVIMFELKKYRQAMFDSTGDWCKMWKKTDFYFQKWNEEFIKSSQAEKLQFHFRKQNGGTKPKLKFKITRSTSCSVKTLLYLENKMNSTINKAFYICSTKSLFLRYKKFPRKLPS